MEATGVFGLRPNRMLVHTGHALLDVECVHLFDDPRNDIGIGCHNVGDVFEHVLSGELKLLKRLLVFQVGLEEVVRGLLVFDARIWETHTEINNAKICRHTHVLSPCCDAPIR
ncbi:unannotated protein [freshwater metagenome]|uniref:Unannotated protein n=1 Tax=freshwater metagenome TaxID=449393 RepID=A0A6J6AQJ5_9ZZZZ